MCFSGFKTTDVNDLGETAVMKTQLSMFWLFYQSLFAMTPMSVCEDGSISKGADGELTGEDVFNKACRSEKINNN